ncbi:MAG: GAF domain-containing protein [Trueperaceae bacterium]|nr:GAF domain-containing protein [Trueperaceae bacterium]
MLEELSCLEKRLERSTRLLHLCQQISWQQGQGLEAIANTVLEGLRELDFENTSLFLREGDDQLKLVASRGKSSGIAFRQGSPISFGKEGATEAVFIEDVKSQPVFEAGPDLPALPSALVVPLYGEREYLGVLVFGLSGRPPEEDIEDIKLLASHASMAIANARRFEFEKRRSEKLELIAKVGQHIASRLSHEELVTKTLEELQQQLDYDQVALFLLDPSDEAYLVLQARTGHGSNEMTGVYRQSIKEGILGRVARERKALLVHDVQRHPDFISIPDTSDIVSELCIPILLEEKLLGVLDLASSKTLAEEDKGAIQIIADQLAVAIGHSALFSEISKRLDETHLLYQASRQISSAVTLREIALAYLELVASQGKYNCTIVIYEYDAQGERKRLNVLGRWQLERGFIQEHEIYPYFKDDFDEILDRGQAVLMTNVLTDSRASPTLKKAQKDRPALAIIPLMVAEKRIGLVTLNHPKPHDWPEVELRPYQLTAAQLAAAIFSRQQAEQVRQQEQALVALNERQRLARDLHDSVSQLLFSMVLIAQSIGPAMERSVAEGEARVSRLLELAQQSRAEMRALLGELRPMHSSFATMPDSVMLRKQGLVATLEHHLRRLPDNLGLSLQTSGYQPQQSEHEQALLRISQEAVNNVVKHAEAKSIIIRLHSDEEACYLSIKDDGQGFDRLPQEGTHLGLTHMRERTEALGGTLKIDSRKGHGSEVMVRFPLKN